MYPPLPVMLTRRAIQPQTPEQVPVQPEDDFLVLACDGIWDVMSSQQAVTYIHRRLIKHHDVQRASHEASFFLCSG